MTGPLSCNTQHHTALGQQGTHWISSSVTTLALGCPSGQRSSSDHNENSPRSWQETERQETGGSLGPHSLWRSHCDFHSRPGPRSAIVTCLSGQGPHYCLTITSAWSASGSVHFNLIVRTKQKPNKSFLSTSKYGTFLVIFSITILYNGILFQKANHPETIFPAPCLLVECNSRSLTLSKYSSP